MLADLLHQRFGGTWRCRALRLSGFCDTWRAESDSIGVLFVKSTPPARADVLEAEADGLRALAASGTIRVPGVVDMRCDSGLEGGLAWLALEWLDFEAESGAFGARFGADLAALHLAPVPGEGLPPPAVHPEVSKGRFGWHRGNWLGGTPQRNRWSAASGREGWIDFVTQRRLRAFADGLASPLVDAVERVIEIAPRLFDEDGHVPRPALVHGDLWSGNWACLRGASTGPRARSVPVIFDPAVSVADAEYELAMMELFGAPPAGFWPAYRERMRIAEGYPRRRPLYQLVHLLNHARLFGGGYERQAFAVCASLLAR